MKFDNFGYVYPEKEKGEPFLRSCWECNPSHERLKHVKDLYWCFSCGKFWIGDKFLSDFYEKDKEGNIINSEKGTENCVKYFRSLGIEEKT